MLLSSPGRIASRTFFPFSFSFPEEE